MKIRDRIISSLCWALLACWLVISTVPMVQSKVPSNNFQTAIADNAPAALLDRGRLLYAESKFVEAATVWQQAATAYAEQQDWANQAWSLSYLALANQALGQWQQAETAIARSLELLQRSQPEAAIQARVFNIQGHLQSSTGKTKAAIQTWQQAEAAYRTANDRQGILGSKINQSQALRRLGLYRQSEKILNSVDRELQTQPDSAFKVRGLQSLGLALHKVGKLSKSQTVLERSLAIANKLDLSAETSSILFKLGNNARERPDLTQSLKYYQLSLNSNPSPQAKLETQLNLLRLYLQLEQPQRAIALIPQVKANLNNTPPNRASVNAAVNFAESLSQLETLVTETGIANGNDYFLLAKKTLTDAINEAQALKDMRAQALVLTQLGKLIAPQQQTEALIITTNALELAQQANASEIIARAAWQLGKLYQQQENMTQATISYELAFDTLQTLRNDLATTNSETQFSFTETIEPIYRQLVSLLLTPTEAQKPIAEAKLKKARQAIEALQLAELDNFFREACLKTQSAQIEAIDPKAAVIYPIILDDRLEVIISIPGQPLRNYTIYKDRAEVESILGRMRQSLNPAYSKTERLQLYQQAYSWLIEPGVARLEEFEIETLVFVLDGSLRNLPMAALYDGQHYLLEKYSIAVSPGLQLLQPQNLATQKIQAIAAGLSEANQGYRALPGVEQELIRIDTQIESKILLNQDFTQSNLQDTIDRRSFSVLHLATHGKFSSNAEDTFVLAWNGKINVKEFDSLVRSRGSNQSNRIELLVLSACQTAKGDPKAALGLAGLAVRSGASSTLGTLWAVRDRSTTKLMTEFYQHLGKPGVTRAEALRRAQLSLLQGEYSHPVYWAAFVLVGNWS